MCVCVCGLEEREDPCFMYAKGGEMPLSRLLHMHTLNTTHTSLHRYEVMTFSRPDHPLATLTYPLVRFYQRKYGNDSAAAMTKALMPCKA